MQYLTQKKLILDGDLLTEGRVIELTERQAERLLAKQAVIRMVAGSYGCREDGKTVQKTAASGAFAVAEEEAERLIAAGMAEDVLQEEFPAYDATMKREQLNVIAAQVGVIKPEQLPNKEAVLQAITAARKELAVPEEETVIADGEAPPVLGTAAPVGEGHA